MKKKIFWPLFIGTSVIAASYTYESIQEKNDLRKIKSYGKQVTTRFGTMNLSISGEKGPVILLLSGYGSAAPILDFKPLADRLSTFSKVITIEYFGYGESDHSLRPRSVQNICEEIHALMEKLQCDHYYLMAHSISGVYSLYYQHTYPQEILGIIGIDPSVPQQIDYIDASLEEKLMKPLRKIGLLRLIDKIKPALLTPPSENYDKESLFTIRAMTFSDKNETLQNEGQWIHDNFEHCRDLQYPSTLPILIFLSSENISRVKWWKKLHEEQIANCKNAKMIELKGSHYLHWTQSDEMAKQVYSFLEEQNEKEI